MAAWRLLVYGLSLNPITETLNPRRSTLNPQLISTMGVGRKFIGLCKATVTSLVMDRAFDGSVLQHALEDQLLLHVWPHAAGSRTVEGGHEACIHAE